jgi:predicted enzyme related to lactoylglutathione lyase
MIKGLRTVIYPVADLTAAKHWYRQVLEIDPYFDQPFYVGFSVGGFELGLVPSDKPGSATSYWGVPDAAAELARLIQFGAVVHEPLKDVGDGINVATLQDPDGNLFGIIENPHFNVINMR